MSTPAADVPMAPVYEDRSQIAAAEVDEALMTTEERHAHKMAQQAAGATQPAAQPKADYFPGDDGEDAPPPAPDSAADAPPADDDAEAEDEHEIPQPDDSVEDIIEPKLLPVPRTLIDEKGRSKTYTQSDLQYFEKIELYGIFGRAVDIAMQGENGLGIDDLMSGMNPKSFLDLLNDSLPGAETSPDAEDRDQNSAQQAGLQQAGKMLATFSRVLSMSPDMLKEVYCLALHIPKGHRRWATEQAFPLMDDDTGEDIMETFFDQNWGAMERFFTRVLPKQLKRIRAARERSAAAAR